MPLVTSTCCVSCTARSVEAAPTCPVVHQKPDADWLAFVATYVPLDTNQWDRMPALRHRVAAALLYAVQARGDTVIGLPTVVRAEVSLHLGEKHDKAMREVERSLGEVRQILGSAVHVERASDDAVRDAFDARLDELREVVEEVTVLDDDLAAAGRMVLAYEPPNTREVSNTRTVSCGRLRYVSRRTTTSSS